MKWSIDPQPPVVVRGVFYAWLLICGTFWLLGVTTPWWAPQAPDVIHSFPVTFRGSRTFYYRPTVGWFVQNYLWIHVIILASLILGGWYTSHGRGKSFSRNATELGAAPIGPRGARV